MENRVKRQIGEGPPLSLRPKQDPVFWVGVPEAGQAGIRAARGPLHSARSSSLQSATAALALSDTHRIFTFA
jgi:hypothetical protein